MGRRFAGRLINAVISQNVISSDLNVFQIVFLTNHALLDTTAFVILLVCIESLHIPVNVLRLLLLSQQVHIRRSRVVAL